MKLKQLAALLFRMSGALFIFTGLDALSGIFDTNKIGAIAAATSGMVIGILAIYFSKKLAALFCRGLGDD